MSKAGQAKVLGTVVCVGVAILLSFYHGPVVGVGQSRIHWKFADNLRNKTVSNHVNFVLGPFMLIASSVSWAVWLIIQVSISKFFRVCTLSLSVTSICCHQMN